MGVRTGTGRTGTGRKRYLRVVASLVGCALLGVPGLGGPATASTGAPRADLVTAVLVDSWNHCRQEATWRRLNTYWPHLGSIPIQVDPSNPAVCDTSFTLADLESTGADVLILDDPAGSYHQFTADEVSALQTYAEEGHTLVGTFLTFGYTIGSIDNSALAPVFGLQADAGWGSFVPAEPTYRLSVRRAIAKGLIRGLPRPYDSQGYPDVASPSHAGWTPAALAGAHIAGRTDGDLGAITVYQEGGYDAIYIANMPEYRGALQDRQFLYNAIVYGRSG